MRTNRWLFTTVLAIFMVPVLVLGQQGPRHDMMMKKLDLTAEQETQVEDLATAHQKQMIQLRADLRVAQIELQEAVRNGASEKDVNKKVDALSAAHKAMLQAKTNHQLQVRDIVGTENFEIWMAKRGHRPGRECGMMGPGKGHGMHPGKGMGDGPHRWKN